MVLGSFDNIQQEGSLVWWVQEGFPHVPSVLRTAGSQPLSRFSRTLHVSPLMSLARLET